MSKLIAAARTTKQSDPLLYLAGTAAGATLGTSLVLLSALVYMAAV